MKRSVVLMAVLLVAGFLFLAPAAFGQAVVMLTQGVPQSISGPSVNYAVTLETNNWNGVAVSATSDFNITHFSIPNTTSQLGGTACDFVVGDGNNTALSMNMGSVTEVAAVGRPATLVHSARGSLTVGSPGTFAWTLNDIFYLWEVNITTSGNYNVAVTGPAGLGYAWFRPRNMMGGLWTRRNMAYFRNSVGTPTNGQALNAGMHCLAVFRDGGPGSSGAVTATVSGGGTPNIQAQGITVTGAPVTVTQGGTFQANSSFLNSGTGPGTANYTIFLSTDTTITTGDTQVYQGTTASIGAGSTYNTTDTCTVPVSTTPGSYYVGLYIAAANTAVTSSQDVIVVAGSPPGAFTLIAPANGATGVAVNPTYSWNAATGALTYTLQVALDAGFSNMVINKTGVSGTSDTPTTTLANNTIHYWQVIAVNTFGNTTSTGAPWSFTTIGVPPGAFTLVAPANSATNVAVNPTYSWNASTGATTYTLQVALDAGFSNIVINKTGIVGTSDTPTTTLANNTIHYW
ncbi:MAG: hypothetical protein ACYS47_18505, partial [Planctomycetota bacterium]